MRTLAMASLRRPVPAALPVTTGRRATARPGASCAVSVVYSDGTSAPNSSSVMSANSASPSTLVVVGSATVWTSYFLCFGLLLDLRDLVRLRLLSLVRVIRSRVHLELAQRLAAE